VCSRVGKCCCRNRWAASDSEKRAFGHFTRSDGERGRGSSLQSVSERESAAQRLWTKGRRGPDRCGSSRDRTRNRRRSAHVRGCPLATEGTSDRRAGLIFTEGLAKRSRRPQEKLFVHSKRERRATLEWGTRQGCQRYGRSEVRGRRTPRTNPKRPTEADRAS